MTKQPVFLITRPRNQSATLIQALTHSGAVCVEFPCIDIVPLYNTALQTAAEHALDTSDYCIVTSTNAVLPCFNQAKLYQKKLIAIGPATGRHLAEYGAETIIIPHHYNSEGVLALPHFTPCQGLTVTIFTGENSKPLLKETLEARGAMVNEIICYQRKKPDYTNSMCDAIAQNTYTAIIVTSNDILNNLISFLGSHSSWLKKQPLILHTDLMKSRAKSYGFETIISIADAQTSTIMNNLWRLSQDRSKIKV